MNKSIFLLPETVEFFGITFLVNGVTLTIASIPIIALLLIIIYWRLQVQSYEQQNSQLVAGFAMGSWQERNEDSSYQFDLSPSTLRNRDNTDMEIEDVQFLRSIKVPIPAGVNAPLQGAYSQKNATHQAAGNVPQKDSALWDEIASVMGPSVTPPSLVDLPVADPPMEDPPMEDPPMEDPTIVTKSVMGARIQKPTNQRAYATRSATGEAMQSKVVPRSSDVFANLIYVRGGEHLKSHITITNHALRDSGSIRFGRQQSLCEYTIDDIRVSRLHATIVKRGENLYIQDEGSSGGTFVNTRKLRTKDQQLLKHGDTVHFNEVVYRFEMVN